MSNPSHFSVQLKCKWSLIEHSCSADYQIFSIGWNLLETSVESFKAKRSFLTSCAGKTTLNSSNPKFWLEFLLPPSQDNFLNWFSSISFVFKSHSPRSRCESILPNFLQRVWSARSIIECKLGQTSLYDFVVRQVFCIFVVWRNRIEGISKFTGSNAVFPAQVKIYVFLLPKFSFKHWWMLNGNFKTLPGKCFWLNNTQ